MIGDQLTGAQRVAEYRRKQSRLGLPDRTQRRVPGSFTGCDGEGAGVDELGRQNYVLFRMGERELWKDGRRLSSFELLDFICSHPKDEILVGFAFGYDVTMILRDIGDKQQRRLFEPKDLSEGHSPFVWYKTFDIDYLPKQYLKVRRVNIVRDPATGKERRIAVKGSQRVIWETFGFFQKSFAKVLKEFGVATEQELYAIEDAKARRGSDDWRIGQIERDYCALECRFLAELMERLRRYCNEADIRPRTWNGAGKISAALHRKYATIKAEDVRRLVPQGVLDLANMAYYGGRFEITRVGMISQEVHEYDIRSAYPDAMRHLPCLLHGEWREATASQVNAHKGLYVSGAAFSKSVTEVHGELGALPIRSKEGHLYWPLRGRGVYWSVEIDSARRRGFDVKCKGGWTYHKRCECKPFQWMDELYEYRKSIGGSGPGYPIKLGINGAYGKLAQRLGNGAFSNMIWAGLITAGTRVKVNDAIALAPHSIIMAATDAVYCLEPLSLEMGDRLGQWEHTSLEGLFIVQPGLYWCPERRKRKSRGLSGKFFEEPGRTEGFENAWADYGAAINSGLDVGFPSVSVPVPGFIGLRIALARNKPETAGTWVSESRDISFDFTNKRVGAKWCDGHIVTGIKPGSAALTSLPHREFLAAGGAEPWEKARLMLEEQPDYIDLGIPFKD